MQIENVVPILNVDDLDRSRRYYIDVLGFGLEWETPEMISVSRDGHAIMLARQTQGQKGTWIWIGCEDAGALHADFVSKGAIIRMPPTNHTWAYEFQAEDPDGHVLRFGSEPQSQ